MGEGDIPTEKLLKPSQWLEQTFSALLSFANIRTSKAKGDVFSIHLKLIWPLPCTYQKKSLSRVGVYTLVKVKQIRHGFGTAPSSIVSGWGMCGELAVSGTMQELKEWVGVGGVGDREGGKCIHSWAQPCSNLTIALTVWLFQSRCCIVNLCNHFYNPHTKQMGRYDPFRPALVSFVFIVSGTMKFWTMVSLCCLQGCAMMELQLA